MDFQVLAGDLISSSSTDYVVQALLGSGSFGNVVQCLNVTTNETVALKVIKNWQYTEQAEEEMAILKMLKELGSDKFNIVKWNGSFMFRGLLCLEFEKMDISLELFLQRRQCQPLNLMEIRPIVQQLAKALDFLKCAGIVHADLKPDNIMMVNHKLMPLKVKIIDFGLALSNPAAHTGAFLQNQWYRAPEIMLGAPFTEAIDVWSLGCITAEMLMNCILFPGTDEFDVMRHIYHTVEKPSPNTLNSAMYAQQFYTLTFTSSNQPIWRFLSTLELGLFNFNPRTLNSLSDLMTYKVSPTLSGEDLRADQCDRAVFVNLLIKTLRVNGADRITPSEILQHPFITMSHLVSTFNHCTHVKKGVELMNVCEDLSSDHDQETSTCTAGYTHHGKSKEGHSSGLDSRQQHALHDNVINVKVSQSKKRERDGEDDGEYEKRSSYNTQEKKAKTESVLTETGCQTCSQQSRNSDCKCLDGSFPPKNRIVGLSQELMDSVKKLLSTTEAAQSNLTQVYHPQESRRVKKKLQIKWKNKPPL